MNAQLAIELGSAILPAVIQEILAALEEGLDEKAAVQRALERMHATALPEPVLDELVEKFRKARERAAPRLGAPTDLDAIRAALTQPSVRAALQLEGWRPPAGMTAGTTGIPDGILVDPRHVTQATAAVRPREDEPTQTVKK